MSTSVLSDTPSPETVIGVILIILLILVIAFIVFKSRAHNKTQENFNTNNDLRILNTALYDACRLYVKNKYISDVEPPYRKNTDVKHYEERFIKIDYHLFNFPTECTGISWICNFYDNTIYIYPYIDVLITPMLEETFYIREREYEVVNEVFSDDIKKRFGLDDIPLIKIPVANIQSYQLLGDKYTTTSVSGGGGGGSSLGGAVIGGVIAGGAGAVIGSRKKIDPISSTTETVDERYVLLRYFDEQGKLSTLKISPNVYDSFQKWFPDKDHEYLIVNQENQTSNTETILNAPATEQENSDIKSRLQKLQGLKDDDIITEEEYNTRRNKIIDEI